MTHTPDTWVVVHVKDNDYRILAGWSGGYLDGDSWRLNSGVARAELVPSVGYDVHGDSGSVYRCFFGNYGLRMSTAGIATRLQEKGVLVMEEEAAIKYLERVAEQNA